MPVNRLEALADAIIHYSGWNDPESDIYQARNPGGLKAFAKGQRKDAKGNRVFTSTKAGYDALVTDLCIKCCGESHTALKQESTLLDLMLAYGQRESSVEYIVKFVRKALKDDTISKKTQLKFFITF